MKDRHTMTPLEIALAQHDAAEANLAEVLEAKHGPDWDQHLGEYHWDMPPSLACLAYRSWYSARVALDAARLAGKSQAMHAEITAKAAELKALFAAAIPEATRPMQATIWGDDVDLAVMRFTRELCDRTA
jgi:hypothetical protein